MSKSNRKIDCGYEIDRENVFFYSFRGNKKNGRGRKNNKNNISFIL